jgi:hypothetical protein
MESGGDWLVCCTLCVTCDVRVVQAVRRAYYMGVLSLLGTRRTNLQALGGKGYMTAYGKSTDD